VLAAAILHDTIEDTQTTESELEKYFGEKISKIVLECTDDKTKSKDDRKKEQIIHSSPAGHMSTAGKLVKLADKYSNLSSIISDPPEKWTAEIIYGYVVWSFAVCKNMFGINDELDNLLDEIFKKFNVTNENYEPFLETYYKLL
jgi:guanosine-3',5'-bis(diphosphate) 3'-pyrophosphohydrolase